MKRNLTRRGLICMALGIALSVAGMQLISDASSAVIWRVMLGVGLVILAYGVGCANLELNRHS